MKSLATLICVLFVSPGVIAGELAIRRFPADAVRDSSLAVSVRNADLIYSTQLLPVGSSGVDLESQQDSLCARTEQLLRSLELAPGNVIKLNLYVADDRDAAALIPVLATRFGANQLPAVSWVTTTLPDPQARLALDFVAARDPAAKGMTLPQPVDGVSSLAVIPASVTSRAFISGQAEKGDGTVTDATRQTMASLFRTLTFLELHPADVVQVKAFITPMSQSADALAAIRAAFAPAPCPPVVFVAWQSPSLPVEIELVAATSKALAAKRPVVEFLTPPGMKSSPVYCKVARVQSPNTIFLSGLYGTQPDPDSEAELRDLFGQTKSLAEGAGSDLQHLVKATYYVSSPGSSQQHNKLRPEYYDPERPPAASKAIVQGVGRPGRTITWDMIAVPKDE